MIGVVSLWPGGLEKGLSAAPLQFLGRISYSLYLVHTIVGMKLMQLSASRMHDSAPLAVLMFLAACVTSVLVACGLYLGVERWGISLGKRLKPRKAAATHSTGAAA